MSTFCDALDAYPVSFRPEPTRAKPPRRESPRYAKRRSKPGAPLHGFHRRGHKRGEWNACVAG